MIASENFQQWAFETMGRRLYRPDEINDETIPIFESVPLKETMHWLQNFIMKPHPKLERTGAVCPYVKPSMDEGLFYLTVVQTAEPESFSELTREMNVFREIFNTMPPFEGENKALRCIMVLFPQTAEKTFESPTEVGKLRADFMRHDITLGHFFPTSDVKKQLKYKFFPHQPPLPLFVFRTFMDFDWVFINKETEWRKIYLEKFGAPPANLAR